MKNHSDVSYIQKTLDLARENASVGGRPFAAIVVKEGELIAQAVNEMHINGDPTAHAEFLAVKRAGLTLQSKKLEDCVVYASGQPYPFCMSAMSLYGIRTAYYAYSRSEWAKFILPIDYLPVEAQQLSPNDGCATYAYWKSLQNPEGGSNTR